MDRFNIRLPAGMRDAIAERAKRNGRSMNSEIVQILEDALNAENTLGEIADKINSVSVPLNVDALVQLQAQVIAMQKEIQEKFREQNEKLRELLNKKPT
jgi:plasmid stability protein